jgi:DNA polymerase-4
VRKIIHVDADSFFASVEMREDPTLAGKPVAVGGAADRRGVVATCNYEARKYGVHSAMPSARARQLCPDLVMVKPHFELYREVSLQFHEIFRDYTDLIEPLSLDEAYLDVSDCEQCQGSATLIANEIRQRIRTELRVTASAGVAPNKFLAKVASDWNKPDGTFTIAPDQVAEFVLQLPVTRIMGVGKVTAAKLEKMGVQTCGDLQQLPLETLATRFGKYGTRLAELAHGVDDRPVKTSRIRKSISVERTYAQDILHAEQLAAEIETVLVELEQRYEKIRHQYHPSKRYIKVKFNDFTQTTIEEKIPDTGEHWLDRATYQRLLSTAWRRQARPVRLLGAGLRLEPNAALDSTQLDWLGE